MAQVIFGQSDTFEPVRIFLGDEGGGHVAADEFWMIHHRRQERQVVADAFDLKTVQRHAHCLDRLRAGRGPGAQLGDHRVVIHADLAALINAGIVAHRRLALGRVALPFAVDQHRARGSFLRRAIAG